MAYRTDLAALEARRAEIASELAQVRERIANLAELRREEERLRTELADTERRLRVKRPLPMLDRVEVAAPCNARWEDMKGDDKVRFCGHCEKNVFNLSAMPRHEAEQFAESAGDACVRFYKRSDGTLLTSDCPVGVRRRRVRRVAAAAIGATALAAGAVGALARPATVGPTMGQMARPTTTNGTPNEDGKSTGQAIETGGHHERPHVMGRMVVHRPNDK